MYTSAFCPYCVNAERLLTAKGIALITKIWIDLQPELRDEMIRKTGHRTVPQIYIDEKYVGGFTELRALDLSGELEVLLGKNFMV